MKLSDEDIIEIKNKLSTATHKLDRIYMSRKVEGEPLETFGNIETSDVSNSIEHLNQHQIIHPKAFKELIGAKATEDLKNIIKEITDVKEKAIANNSEATLFEIEDLAQKLKALYPIIYKSLILRFENLKRFVKTGDFAQIEKAANALEESFSRLVVLGKVDEFEKDVATAKNLEAKLPEGKNPEVEKAKSAKIAGKEVEELQTAEAQAEEAILKVKDAVENLEIKKNSIEAVEYSEEELNKRNPLRKFVSNNGANNIGEKKTKVELKKQKLKVDISTLEKAIENSDLKTIKKQVKEIEEDTTNLDNEDYKTVEELQDETGKAVLDNINANNPKPVENKEEFTYNFKTHVTAIVDAVSSGEKIDFNEAFESLKGSLQLGIPGVKKSDLELVSEKIEQPIKNVFGKCGKDLIESLQVVFITICDELEEIATLNSGVSLFAENEVKENEKSKITNAIDILKNAVVKLEKSKDNENVDKFCTSALKEALHKAKKKDYGKKTDAEKEEAERKAPVVENSDSLGNSEVKNLVEQVGDEVKALNESHNNNNEQAVSRVAAKRADGRKRRTKH